MKKLEANSNEIYVLNPTAIPVKGLSRSILCDIERHVYTLIPNALYELLRENRTGIISEVIYRYSNKDELITKTIEEYFDFLIQGDYIFFTNSPDLFQPLEFEWDYPAKITNAIIDVNDFTDVNFEEILSQLESLGCYAIQIRLYCQMAASEMAKKIFEPTKKSKIQAIEIVLPFASFCELDSWSKLTDLYTRIKYLQFYNAPKYEILQEFGYNGMGLIYLIKDNIENEKCCGVVHSQYFTLNISSYTEAQHHNTCLNRKISIDTHGNIKNCPSMKESYGNIRDTTLREALGKPGFKKYWNINKDQIEVCKDCEFRYICTDCRAYIEDPENIHSKPLKCGYNPFTCEWEEWSTNPLKQKAIEHYGLEELVKKEEKAM